MAVLRSDFSRVFLIENRAGPNRTPIYEGLFKAGTPSWPQGDFTTIKIPDPDRYGEFITIGKIPGERGNPTLPISGRYEYNVRSRLLRLVRIGCESDLQIHMGSCQDPRNFNEGWDKILVLEAAKPTDWGTDADIGALSDDERSLVNEQTPFTGDDLYEILPILFGEKATAEVVNEVMSIVVCDAISCGACGLPSDGCDKVFAVAKTVGGSPGLAGEVIASDDGGETWVDRNITTLAANEDPNKAACVGVNLVIVSEDSESLHYAALLDILNEEETWTEVTTGFVAAKGPLAIFSLGSALTWIVGEGGYIYFTADPTASVTVQDAGNVTIQDLNDIHGIDSQNLVAVGNSNAVVYTRNGGTTWSLVVGPAVGVALNAIWMRGKDEWLVGSNAGRLYYTIDAGENWTEKTFPGSGAGVIRDIQFSTNAVGWMSHDTATPAGRILRTLDGGNSWYVAPEGVATIPANDRINQLAPCGRDPNVIYGGGLADNATDGFIAKGA